ncbi:MAG: hypothetical protein ACSLE2_10845 [Lysobacterales bacterium]
MSLGRCRIASLPGVHRTRNGTRGKKAELRRLARAIFEKQPQAELSEEEEQQLRQLGATDEYIDNKRTFIRAAAERNVDELVLWPDLVDSYSVFTRCRWQVVATMAGVFWNGIAAPEIESVAAALAIVYNGELLDDLRLMESAASEVLNKRPAS